MNVYTIMFYLFMGLLAIFGVVRILAAARIARVQKKRIIFDRLLKEAKSTRMTYIRNIEASDDFRIKLEGMRSELESEKFRLKKVRASVREIVDDIRSRLAASNIDKVEANVIAQKKIAISEQWKVLENFRREFNKKFASYKLIEREQRIHSQKTTELYDKWETQKGALMRLYDEIRPVADIEDPRAILATASQS